ncbi:MULTISPECIES: hypothetical protein [unclassified Photobacterium]|uniref:hypothetical protein n=1 Tax=unclassified Photobacterium TaxID=2628852 RepID=UPI001EE0EBB3|nr:MULTISPECIES: hypothetical protein [unclassified Photobacterium]MCG3864681.1 hypothetical protein [Photobacterium sp. Ph6]MCG3876805.1 hypothetical protein [Photobacterium sp. Ph5]
MTDLKHLFFSLGLEQLDLSEKEQNIINAFIHESTPRFDDICRQRQDKEPLALLLGFMTQQYQIASSRWVEQQTAYHQMQSVFQSTVGTEHASKFLNQDADEYMLITLLWLLVQGANRIDYSYANEQAETLLTHINEETKKPNNSKENEQLRQRLLQAFYQGKNATQQSLFTKLKRMLKLS